MKSWDISINGKNHNIEYSFKKFKNYVTVDGETTLVHSKSSVINLVDYEFKIDDTICNLTALGRKANLAVNGTYLNTNEPYKPFNKVPIWVTVLSFISMIGGFLLSGVISFIIGAIMSAIYISSAIKGKTSRIIFLFVICTAIQVAIMFFFVYIRLSNGL